MFQKIRGFTCAVLMVLYISKSVCQCPSGCKCSAALTVCSFGTKLTSFPNNLPTQITALTLIGSRNNPNTIGQLSASMFPFSKMLHLKLIYSGIETIQDGCFSSLSALKSLDISFNKVKEVTAETFQGINGLVKLDLSGNENCNIGFNVFNGFTGLQELSLAEMNLQTLDGNIINKVKMLLRLDIHGNSFTSIDWATLQSLANLQRLDLSQNQLTTIPMDFKPTLERLSGINLADNPWHCNWEMKWLRDSKGGFNAVVRWENVICESPDDLRFMSITNVPDQKLDPVSPKIIHCDNKTTRVDKGSPVVINCSIKGDPFPTVTWTNPTGTVFECISGDKNGYMIFKNGTLYIKHASAVDTGNWTIQLASKFGEDQSFVNIFVVLSTTTTQTTTTTTTPTTTTATPTTITTSPTTTTSMIITTPTPITTTPTNTSTLVYYAAGGGIGLLILMLTIIVCCVRCKKDKKQLFQILYRKYSVF